MTCVGKLYFHVWASVYERLFAEDVLSVQYSFYFDQRAYIKIVIII